MTDATSTDRTAQFLIVEGKHSSGSPLNFPADWTTLYVAKVDRIEINQGAKPSSASIWFPGFSWHDQPHGLAEGDRVRILTDPLAGPVAVIFSGFITRVHLSFSGGTERGGTFERNAIICHDHRWLLSVLSPIFGQLGRSPDDYTDYGGGAQATKDGESTWFDGRRAIFNADARPNKDPDLLNVLDSEGTALYQFPIFADPDIAQYWEARDMVRYFLSRPNNLALSYFDPGDPNTLSGLDNSDWDKVLHHIVIDTLDVIAAVDLICQHLGWSFREEYDSTGKAIFVFFKIASATKHTRSSTDQVILHHLHAPDVGDNVKTAAQAGKKIVWSAEIERDIATVVNKPWGLGAIHRFEFTAELVPAWLDSDFSPDTSGGNADLFFTEAQLQDLTDKNVKSYYNNYHPRSSAFKRDVGRKWALNESGRYTGGTFDRGDLFDFTTVIDPAYVQGADGKRLYGPFNRRLLPCLTVEKGPTGSINSVGIKVEFSFDSGTTWQVIPAAISALEDECGIYITEANLAEIVDETESKISGGTLDDVQLNYYTSIADDKVSSRVFKDGLWKTRVRITASVQMDRRLTRSATGGNGSGSPYKQRAVFDFSGRYKLDQRQANSVFSNSGLPAFEHDHTDELNNHLTGIRKANEDESIAAQFTLERLWLDDGKGKPVFMPGDSIEKITGRGVDLSAALNKSKVYPEIIQVIYLPQDQKTKLIARDLRFTEVVL